MKKIRWGIVGPGSIAHNFAHDFQFVEKGELVAVASRSMERAKTFGEKYLIPKNYGSYEELYQDPDIDAVYVATPHPFHRKNSEDALYVGKAVLCEKPLTHNLGDSIALIDYAHSSGNYLMEGMWTYFLPAIKKAKQWVDEGRIGNILHVKSDFGYAAPFDPKSRMYNPELAGGSLLDIGIYTIAMAWLFYQRDPENMMVISRKAPTGVDHDVSMLFEYEDAAASLNSSCRCKLNNWAYIIGEKGYLAIPDFWRAKECFLYNEEKIVDEFIDSRMGFGFNFEIDAVNNDLIKGRKESETMPLAWSIKLMEHMHRVIQKF